MTSERRVGELRLHVCVLCAQPQASITCRGLSAAALAGLLGGGQDAASTRHGQEDQGQVSRRLTPYSCTNPQVGQVGQARAHAHMSQLYNLDKCVDSVGRCFLVCTLYYVGKCFRF